jgi:hypothetical protein
VSSWFRTRTVIWDVTAPRALALVGHADLMIAVTGITVPRIVADPNDPSGDELLATPADALSELAAAEQYFRHKHRRHREPADYHRAVRLAELRKERAVRCATTRWTLCRSKSCRCWSSCVPVLVDEPAEDTGPE